MGILSKGLTKLLKPEPSDLPLSRRKDVGPLGGPSKKVRNPITKPRVDTTKTITRDIDFDIEDTASIEEVYGDAGGYRDTKGKDYVIPKKIGEFYSPVKDTIEQMPIAKEGSTGQTIEAFLNKRSPSITKSELANTRIKLDPNKKYLREEILALENIPDAYDIRVRSMRDGNVLFDDMQRQPVLDRPEDYFEVTIHTPKIDSEVEQITKGHFPTGTVAHIRASRRKGEDGEDYILIEEVQSDAARAAGQKYDPVDGPDTQESYEFDEAFGHSISMENVMDEEIVEDIARENKIEWMNKDYEEAISSAITDYSTSKRSTFTNPFYSITRRFYRDVHKRYNNPDLYDMEMETPEDVEYLKMQDEALRLDMQGENIPEAYNKPYMRLADDLIGEYKAYFPSLRNDPKFNIYNFQDRSDPDNLKVIPDGIKKIHAYAIKKDGEAFLNEGLPERAADVYEGDMQFASGSGKKLTEKLKDGTVQKYLLEDSPAPFFKKESIERMIKNVEDSVYTKIAPEDIPLGGEVYAKEQVPITTKTETMLKGLQASIVLAKKQGLDKIIIPSYRQFDKTRGYYGTDEESVFKDMYEQAFKKAFNILKTDSKGTLKLATKKIKIAKEGTAPSSYVDNMPHYGGADFDEDFAYEIDISNFEFDPDNQAFRFSKGGTLMDDQMELFNEGGLRDEGGQVEPDSGNKVPSGSLKEEVADDIPVMMSEGEFVFPADVTRFIGLKTLMKMRQDAKQGLKTMEDMGQMGNSEEATLPDDMPFEMADLIVVSGNEPKKMQSGGLLDDPRFQRPTGGGGDTPTITPEEKKEMEDALLRTGYGNVVMKRYVNADGDVKYIPFIDGEPQMEIPEGYELDESAPKQQTSIGGGYTDSGGGDSGGPASLAPAFGDGQTFQKPKIMVDGVEYENIEKMDSETLLKYYEQFNSPIYRYAATFATLFFSPLVGGAIAIGQSFSNKNSPNGLNAVQQKLMTMKLTPEQRKRAKKVFDDIAKKGSGGLSAITKGVTNFLGLTSDKKKGEKETDFEKFLRTGNIKGATTELGNKLNDPNNKKLVDDNSKNIYAQYKSEGRPQTLAATPAGDDFFGEQQLGELGSRPEDLSGSPFDNTAPATVEQIEPVSALQTKIDPVTGEETEGDPFAPIERAKPAGTELGSEAGAEVSPVEEDRSKKRLTTGEQDLQQLKNQTVAMQVRMQAEAEDIRKKADELKKRTSMGTDYGKQRVQQDDDRDDGGSSSIDDFFGSDFGYTPPTTTFTPTKTPVYTSQTAGGQQRPQTLGVPSTPSIGTGGGGRGQRFGPTGGFYVGGVPTKPMKPQRLKKGGLAKPKVKPKRMKKGGLASRKK